MIKCTGAHCPIQHDPEKPFNPMECQAADTCPNATPITDEQLWLMAFLCLSFIEKSKEKVVSPIEPSNLPVCNCHSDICESGTSFEQSCYFYHEEQDMGAHIPCCSKTGKMDQNGCNKECKYYIPKGKAFRIISDYQSHEDEE